MGRAKIAGIECKGLKSSKNGWERMMRFGKEKLGKSLILRKIPPGTDKSGPIKSFPPSRFSHYRRGQHITVGRGPNQLDEPLPGRIPGDRMPLRGNRPAARPRDRILGKDVDRADLAGLDLVRCGEGIFLHAPHSSAENRSRFAEFCLVFSLVSENYEARADSISRKSPSKRGPVR